MVVKKLVDVDLVVWHVIILAFMVNMLIVRSLIRDVRFNQHLNSNLPIPMQLARGVAQDVASPSMANPGRRCVLIAMALERRRALFARSTICRSIANRINVFAVPATKQSVEKRMAHVPCARAIERKD